MALILLAVGLITLIYFYVNYTKTKRIKDLAKSLPGPPALPVIGNGLAIFKNSKGVLYYLIKAQKTYGKVTRHWLGSSMLYTLLTDPKDVEILLRDTKNLSKSSNYEFIKPWLGKGLITSTGNHWHKHRKIITPTFHFNILEKFVEVFNEKGRILIKRLKEKVDQESFDVYPYINIYAFDVIIETAMGMKWRAQEDANSDYVRAVYQITNIVHKRSFSFLHRSAITFPFTSLAKQQREVLNILQEYCDKVIQQRKAELSNTPTNSEGSICGDIGRKRRLAFLDLLLLGQRNNLDFSDQDIREEVNTFLFAGHDTTTSGIAFCLYYLANYPDVQQKVYDEILEILEDPDRDLILKDLNKFKYLDQVVKEVLRLAPPVPIISRTLESDLKISNYILPTGSAAGIFIYMLHRDPIIYPDPEKFDPTRFSDENCVGRHPYVYVPFSAGPRNCIGQKYAQLEIKSTIIKILLNFRLLSGQPIDLLVVNIVLRSSNGINIKLENRKS